MRPVEVTWHALEQFRSRFPLESGSSSHLRLLIGQEVDAALECGRYATKQPKWASKSGMRGRRNGGEIDRTLRFCWTEDMRRMYLVDKHGGVVRVVTAIAPEGDKLST